MFIFARSFFIRCESNLSQASPKNKVALPLITVVFWGLTRPRIGEANRSLYALLGDVPPGISLSDGKSIIKPIKKNYSFKLTWS